MLHENTNFKQAIISCHSKKVQLIKISVMFKLEGCCAILSVSKTHAVILLKKKKTLAKNIYLGCLKLVLHVYYYIGRSGN